MSEKINLEKLAISLSGEPCGYCRSALASDIDDLYVICAAAFR